MLFDTMLSMTLPDLNELIADAGDDTSTQLVLSTIRIGARRAYLAPVKCALAPCSRSRISRCQQHLIGIVLGVIDQSGCAPFECFGRARS